MLGEKLGPRPLLVLNTAVRSQGDDAAVIASLAKWQPLLSALNWRYGCVSLPLVYDPTAKTAADGDSWLELQVGRVLRLMDCLSVAWTHVVGHGSGVLLAARMAHSAPDRIGTILSMDSPLLSREWMAKEKAREELAAAALDVNIPRDLLEMFTEELTSSLEPPLGCVVEETTASSSGDGGAICAEFKLMSEHLFDPAFLFGPPSEKRGLSRSDARFMPAKAVASIRHPIMLVSPSPSAGGEAAAEASPAIADAGFHKDVFSIRRAQPIKAAKSHSELFSPAAAEEVAAVANQWLTRFEPDVVMQRRVEQALKDTKAKLGDSSGGPAAPTAAATAGKGTSKKKDAGEKREKKK
jgi:pimeloyl-ACP methyl ester carboxylesterase